VTDQDRNKAWGFALFADDVRFELGGKNSLMGLYQSDMLFPSSMKVPFVLSKFVIQINYYEVIGTIAGDISFRVTYGAQNMTIADMPLLRKDIETAIGTLRRPETSEDSEPIFHLRSPIVLSPFPVAEMGRIRVRAHYADGAILKLGSIAMKQLPDEEFKALTGIPVVSPPQT
jgi:hypothetical protein